MYETSNLRHPRRQGLFDLLLTLSIHVLIFMRRPREAAFVAPISWICEIHRTRRTASKPILRIPKSLMINLPDLHLVSEEI